MTESDPPPGDEIGEVPHAWPRDPEARPRERLLDRGPGALTDRELLAVLLRVGRKGEPVERMAARILEEVGGLDGLATCRDRTRLETEGVGPAKAAGILAAVELAHRLARSRLPSRELLDRPEAVVRWLRLRFGRLDQEVMGAVYVDVRHRLIEAREVFRGTLSRAAVEPRGLLRPGLTLGAAGLLLWHTHPSGDPSPSAEDLAFTRRLSEAAEIVGVRLVDHLVIGDGERWVSLRRQGAW